MWCGLGLLCGIMVRDVEAVVRTKKSCSVTVATVWRRWDLLPLSWEVNGVLVLQCMRQASLAHTRPPLLA